LGHGVLVDFCLKILELINKQFLWNL